MCLGPKPRDVTATVRATLSLVDYRAAQARHSVTKAVHDRHRQSVLQEVAVRARLCLRTPRSTHRGLHHMLTPFGIREGGFAVLRSRVLRTPGRAVREIHMVFNQKE
jgi:hypothetical protein